MFRNQPYEPARVDGLGNIALASRIQSVLFGFGYSRAAKSNDSHFARISICLQHACQLEAVHSWKLNVHEDEARVKRFQHLQGFFSVDGSAYTVPFGRQQGANKRQIS